MNHLSLRLSHLGSFERWNTLEMFQQDMRQTRIHVHACTEQAFISNTMARETALQRLREIANSLEQIKSRMDYAFQIYQEAQLINRRIISSIDFLRSQAIKVENVEIKTSRNSVRLSRQHFQEIMNRTCYYANNFIEQIVEFHDHSKSKKKEKILNNLRYLYLKLQDLEIDNGTSSQTSVLNIQDRRKAKAMGKFWQKAVK